jgi:hypothetical protein
MIGKYFELKSNGDIIKKMSDSTNFSRFEDYLKTKGLTMKSKHSTIEKLYKEWEYNRTIHWDEPIDETDTEEITSERTIRFSSSSSPWLNPISNAEAVPHPMPIRRRREEMDMIPNNEPTTDPEDTTVTFDTHVFDSLVRLTEIPGNRQGDEHSVPAPNTNHQLDDRGRGRIVRPDEPRRDNIFSPEVGIPLRFTMSNPIMGRPVVEERPIDPPDLIENPTNGDIVINTLGGVDTSADGNQENQPSSMADYLRQWDDMRHMYTWIDSPYTHIANLGDIGISTRDTNSANGEETDDGNQ